MILHSPFTFLSIFSCCVIVAALSHAQDPFGSDPGKKVTSVVSPEPIAPILKATNSTAATNVDSMLKQKVVWELNDVPFAEFQELARKNLGINMHLHDSARNDSLTEDDRINFRCNATVDFGKSLELVLERYHADYVVDGNLVKVISRDVVSEEEFLIREIFDARPLIQAAAAERLAQYAGDPEPPHPWEINMIVEEELVDLIQQTICLESWEENGGTGTIVSLNGLLVVNQSRRQLESIRSLLGDLKSKMTQQ